MSVQELQKIKGIGPKFAQKLAAAGIVSLEDLARSTPEQLAEIVQARGALARYDDWIRQAREMVDYSPPPSRESAAVSPQIQAELDDLVHELNDLAAQLKRLEPHFQPPPYSPQRMKGLLLENLDRFTPEALKGLQESLEGTSLEDFKDIETWKGVWFTLNYLVRLEATERGQGLLKRLVRLPGISTLADLKEMLQDTPPEEFLNPETWKGVWFVVNYELRNAASGLKKRALGEEDEPSDS